GTPILSVDSRGGVRDVFRGDLEKYLTPRTAEGLARGLESVAAMLPVEVKPEWLEAFGSKIIVEAFLSQP
ncbi:MAG: glycosyltransferase, partial [Marinobacter sp.]|nr:glycosyltransferase [Marinobacter sp.]